MRVQRAYRYRCYPTEEQAEQLARSFGCARWIYNWGLQQRTDAFYKHGQRLYYKDLARQLKWLKQHPDTAWLSEVSSVVLQQALRHLDTAFARFFKKEAGYPTYTHQGRVFGFGEPRVGWRRAGVSTAWKPSSSLQGWIHGVPRSPLPDPRRSRITEKFMCDEYINRAVATSPAPT